MLSIDRVKVNALSLFGLMSKVEAEEDNPSAMRSDRSRREGETRPSAVPLSPRTPPFDAVETALKQAGYLDS